MSYHIDISARAKRDLDSILAWLAERSPQSAAQWHAALLTKVVTLEDHPERCPLAVEAEQLGVDLRELLFGKRRNVYRILFTIDGEIVNVHRLYHAARKWLETEDL